MKPKMRGKAMKGSGKLEVPLTRHAAEKARISLKTQTALKRMKVVVTERTHLTSDGLR